MSVCLQQALLEEQHTYLDHLAEQLRRDKEQEREDEELFKEERDKVWAEKVEKMKQERETRFQLLRDVMKTRQSQMEEKCKWWNAGLGRGRAGPCCWEQRLAQHTLCDRVDNNVTLPEPVPKMHSYRHSLH